MLVFLLILMCTISSKLLRWYFSLSRFIYPSVEASSNWICDYYSR